MSLSLNEEEHYVLSPRQDPSSSIIRRNTANRSLRFKTGLFVTKVRH